MPIHGILGYPEGRYLISQQKGLPMTSDDTRVWFITGASSGLGRALAETALDRGERVVATARDPERVAELADRHPDRAAAVRLDVTDPEQARAAVEKGLAAFERIDVVVNNAGYGLFGALEELSDADLRREFDTNVFGALAVTRAALPHLRERPSGHIVQISSLEGVAPAVGGEAAYAGTKFAVEGIAEGLAKEVAHLGIRVTIVEPGPVRTDFAAGAIAKPRRTATTGRASGRRSSGSRTSPDSNPTTPPGSPRRSSRRSTPTSPRSGCRSARRRSRRFARSSTASAVISTPGSGSASRPRSRKRRLRPPVAAVDDPGTQGPALDQL